MLCFVYFQIMPEFVDFLFSFGQQARAQDFHYSCFRQRTRLSSSRQGLKIIELGWSGRDFQVCYNIKSVESSSSQTPWPWSIRHCAISHSFDVENIRPTWIIVKGDRLIEKRIHAATSDRGPPQFRNFSTIDRAFAASLGVHLLLCYWSAENWRWYINFLEERVEEISGRTISNEIDIPPTSPSTDANGFAGPSRASTDLTEKSIFSRLSRKKSTTWGTLSSIREKRSFSGLHIDTNAKSSKMQLPGLGGKGKVMISAQNEESKLDEYGQHDFSFGDMQALHHADKRANEAALVITHNLAVLSQLVQYYQTIRNLDDFPNAIKDNCEEDIREFETEIHGIEMDLKMQSSRLDTLMRLISDCKSLVRKFVPRMITANFRKLHGILEFRNTRSNKLLAQESRASTMKMELMTIEMNDIARKTKTETVSMKIITLVTLFFLPGTFISVCDISLLMNPPLEARR